MSELVHTFCRICEARCGVAVTVEGDEVLRIAPDKDNPHTWKDFCAKGRTADEIRRHPLRIRAPMRRVADRYVETSWEEAVSGVSEALRSILDREGPDAIAFYTGNPWGFSGSNPLFVAGLMDAIGTKSRFNVGSVDQNNAMVVAKEMYGSDLISLVPDVDSCRCFLFVGMNPADSAFVWVGAVPDGWRRVLAAQERGADLIVVDPRRTATAARASTHVAIRPGQDWAFLLAVLKTIFAEGLEDDRAVNAAEGGDRLRALADEPDLAMLAGLCDVPAATIVDVARRFASAPTAMCVARTGVSQNRTGTIGEWLSQALNVVTGRVDAVGGRRFERGYVDLVRLADRLVPPLPARSRVRDRPAVWGGFALAELADEILTPGPGRVRALLVDAGNPVVAGPNGRALDRALADLELLVAFDLVQRESHRHAHWLIPAAHWLEREELLLAFSSLEDEPFVQYARQAVPPPPGVREEWEFFVDVALAMGVPLFGRRGLNSAIRVSRALARALRRPGLAFHPRWLQRLVVASGRRLKWRDVVAHPHGWVYGEREYGHLAGALRTPGGRIHVAPPAFVEEARRQLATDHRPPAGLPLALVGRRHRKGMNSWLNDLPSLGEGRRGDLLEMHPDDAAELGVAHGDRVRVSSRVDDVEMVAALSADVRRGVVVAEQGWGSRVFDPSTGAASFDRGVNRNRLVDDADLDPLSNIPALNCTWVAVGRVAAGPHDDRPA